MPIIKSAIKRDRQQKKRHERNVKIKTGVKIKQKAARTAIASDPKKAQEALVLAISEIDRAVKKGALHKNTGSRRVSRLTQAYNAKADKPFGTDKPGAAKKKTTSKSSTVSKKTPAKASSKKKSDTKK